MAAIMFSWPSPARGPVWIRGPAWGKEPLGRAGHPMPVIMMMTVPRCGMVEGEPLGAGTPGTLRLKVGTGHGGPMSLSPGAWFANEPGGILAIQ